MITTDKKSCQILSDLLYAHGVEQVVISPGSRNTPIILALDANSKINKSVVIDERCAAYIALGIARTTNRPVAIVCTSGTALLNYAPAVAEAYYQGIPLIVISADRPIQWIDQDDSQTIRQFDALSNIVKKSYDIPDFDCNDSEMCWYVNRVINDALLTAVDRRNGPVHINIQLNQPLSNMVDLKDNKHQRLISSITTNTIIDEKKLSDIFSSFCMKKILIIGGFYQKNEEINNSLNKLSKLANVVILTETISNIYGDDIISNIDRVIAPLSEQELNQLKPDIVISFGGALVSRYIKQFLRKYNPERHFSIGYSHTTIDCFKSLTDKVDINPEYFFTLLFENISKFKSKETYRSDWQNINNKSLTSHNQFINTCKWSDLKAFSIISDHLSKSKNKLSISLSNGTPIRYFQLFNEIKFDSCYCNRGVSGIDGCTSTAIGVAIGNNLQSASTENILITGDMSFSYDIGSLATHFIPDNFKIIVINNSGGGIFRFIQSTSSLPQLETYFAVKPNINIKKISESYNFEYFMATDREQLITSLNDFILSNKKSILEIVTPPEVSGELLRKYMNRKI